MRKVILFLVVSVLLTHLFYAVTDYDLKRVYPVKNVSNDGWVPLNTSTYKMVGDGTIRKRTEDFISDLGNCQVFSVDDWNCGNFGFLDGDYYDNDSPADWKYVGRLKYYIIRCHWEISIECPFGVMYGR